MGTRFDLPAELTIYSIMEARDALLSWIETHKTGGSEKLEVSAAQVAEVDGSGLQLLVALAHAHQGWQLVEPSNALTTACQTLGLVRWMEQRVGGTSP